MFILRTLSCIHNLKKNSNESFLWREFEILLGHNHWAWRKENKNSLVSDRGILDAQKNET